MACAPKAVTNPAASSGQVRQLAGAGVTGGRRPRRARRPPPLAEQPPGQQGQAGEQEGGHADRQHQQEQPQPPHGGWQLGEALLAAGDGSLSQALGYRQGRLLHVGPPAARASTATPGGLLSYVEDCSNCYSPRQRLGLAAACLLVRSWRGGASLAGLTAGPPRRGGRAPCGDRAGAHAGGRTGPLHRGRTCRVLSLGGVAAATACCCAADRPPSPGRRRAVRDRPRRIAPPGSAGTGAVQPCSRASSSVAGTARPTSSPHRHHPSGRSPPSTPPAAVTTSSTWPASLSTRSASATSSPSPTPTSQPSGNRLGILTTPSAPGGLAHPRAALMRTERCRSLRRAGS